MKKIMIGVVALALLGGGAGGYFYFMKPAEASVGEDGAHEEVKDDHGKDGHGALAEFVKLDPLILPIVDGSGVTQTVSLVVSLEVKDAEARKKIEEIAPRLKDAYIQDMYGVLNKHAALKGGVLQVDILKTRLNKVSAKVVGDDVVQDVLLQVVQQRQI